MSLLSPLADFLGSATKRNGRVVAPLTDRPAQDRTGVAGYFKAARPMGHGSERFFVSAKIGRGHRMKGIHAPGDRRGGTIVLEDRHLAPKALNNGGSLRAVPLSSAINASGDHFGCATLFVTL